MFNVTADLSPDEVHPGARAIADRRASEYIRDSPSTLCLPEGPRRNRFPFHLMKIVQTPALIVMLSEDLTYRQIFLDGRALPESPNPSFMGYSVGRWEGDTLVVTSVGFNERTWLDMGGTPHTESLRIVERFSRTRLGALVIEETFEDPGVSARPWTVRVGARLVADTELLEYVCTENERSRPHLVGTRAHDEPRAVHVPPQTLARYQGTYEVRQPTGVAVRLTVTWAGDRLLLDGRPLIPVSETTFTGLVPVRFEIDDQGAATRLFISAVEGDVPAIRIRDER
jgi:hypothetical protein